MHSPHRETSLRPHIIRVKKAMRLSDAITVLSGLAVAVISHARHMNMSYDFTRQYQTGIHIPTVYP